MIEKIISGGQTSTDRAALDAAIELDIPHGGWVPKGRIAEDGVIPDKYIMNEMPTSSYPAHTEQNILDSDGTLIFSHGLLTGGSALTQELADKHKRPCLHVDLDVTSAFMAVKMIHAWAEIHNIRTLNVAGSSASKDPYIYKQTKDILEAVYYFGLSGDTKPESKIAREWKIANLKITEVPKTIGRAVEILISNMALKDKVIMANMQIDELGTLDLTLGDYIRSRFRLSGNKELLNACHSYTVQNKIHAGDASTVIIMALWETLRKAYKLRVVK